MLPVSKRVLTVSLLIFLSLAGCTSPDFDSQLRKAEERMGIGDVKGTIAVLSDLANRYPDDPRRPGVLLRLADALSLMDESPKRAIEAYGEVIRLYPLSDASMLARERRAHHFERIGDFDAAIADYAALLKYFPEHADRYRYRVFMAGAFLSKRQYREARDVLRPLLEDQATPPGVRRCRPRAPPRTGQCRSRRP